MLVLAPLFHGNDFPKPRPGQSYICIYAMQQSYKLEAVHMVDMLRSKREFLREHHLIPLRCSGWSCWKPCCKCEKPMKDTYSECTHPKAGPMICQGTNSLQLSGTTSACSQVLPLMNLNLGRIIFRKWIFHFPHRLKFNPVAHADLQEVPAWLP